MLRVGPKYRISGSILVFLKEVIGWIQDNYFFYYFYEDFKEEYLLYEWIHYKIQPYEKLL